MTETEKLKVALQVAIEQRNAAQNQILDLTVALTEMKQELEQAKAPPAEVKD